MGGRFKTCMGVGGGMDAGSGAGMTRGVGSPARREVRIQPQGWIRGPPQE